MIQDRALAEAGGKGLFTKEIDAAMLRGEIDVAVHSSKDLPTALPDGICIAGYLPREDPRDALISAKAATIAGLPQGGTLGTASLRRQAQVKRLRPDLQVGLLRGNVETRLGKAERGEIDATLLAYAGPEATRACAPRDRLLDIDDFLPAVGQGAIGADRAGRRRAALDALSPILDGATGDALACERAFLAVLDGSCKTPIAGHARLAGGALHFAARSSGRWLRVFEVREGGRGRRRGGSARRRAGNCSAACRAACWRPKGALLKIFTALCRVCQAPRQSAGRPPATRAPTAPNGALASMPCVAPSDGRASLSTAARPSSAIWRDRAHEARCR